MARPCNYKSKKGITLVALVITIIVMLILAFVTLNVVLGEEGLIKKTETSKVTYVVHQEREAIMVSYSGIKFEKMAQIGIEIEAEKLITPSEFEKALREDGSQVTVLEDVDGNFAVIFTITNHVYTVNKRGAILSMDLNGNIKKETSIEYFTVSIIEGTANGRIKINENGKNNLTKVITPIISSTGATITEIDDLCFNKCKKLNEVVISNGIQRIGTYAFKGCENLKSITMPTSVTYIGEDAFDGCANDLVINYMGTETQWNAITKAGGNSGLTINYTANP